MQTFLPFDDFKKSAAVLDTARLCKQRVEAYQLLDTLRLRKDWESLPPIHVRRHTATCMWRGHERVLWSYAMIMCDEWIHHGCNDSISQKIHRLKIQLPENTEKPWWLGREEFHESHRISLLWKNFDYYKNYFRDKEEQEHALFYLRTGRTYRTWWPTEHEHEKEK